MRARLPYIYDFQAWCLICSRVAYRGGFAVESLYLVSNIVALVEWRYLCGSERLARGSGEFASAETRLRGFNLLQIALEHADVIECLIAAIGPKVA